MKAKRTTSAEKAVVLVFMVSLPLGAVLGYNLRDVPEPEVRKEIIVRTMPVTDYAPTKQADEGVKPECKLAWEATERTIGAAHKYNEAVAKLEPILDRLYWQVMGNDPTNVDSLNAIRNDVDHHKRGDWERLGLMENDLSRLEDNMRQCAEVPG